MIRLFAGLALPADLSARLEAMAGGVPGARWVAARNMHVTLRFFGEIDEACAQDLDHELAAILIPEFSLTVAGFGTFGGRKPRALWAGIEPDPALTRLQSACENAARRAGLEPETRNFTPHVTLAWLSGTPTERIAGFMSTRPPLKSEPFRCGEFHLYRSTLGRGGAEYDSVMQYPLQSK